MSEEWWRLAACRGTDSSDAFGTADEQALFIGIYCRHCPVKQECFEFGKDWEGVYGGTTARQRRAFRKKLELKPCGTDAGYHRHRRHEEKPCEPCAAAHTAKTTERARAKREAA